MSSLHEDSRVARLVAAYTALSRESLPALMALYAETASFKDPFNELQGRADIARVFEHMFDSLQTPRFEVDVAVCQGAEAFLSWRFLFGSGRAEFCIRGASHLRFDAAGLVTLHRDYWDAAEELYAKLPLLGALMRYARRRLSAPQPAR